MLAIYKYYADATPSLNNKKPVELISSHIKDCLLPSLSPLVGLYF